jgi:hypothetical protein
MFKLCLILFAILAATLTLGQRDMDDMIERVDDSVHEYVACLNYHEYWTGYRNRPVNITGLDKIDLIRRLWSATVHVALLGQFYYWKDPRPDQVQEIMDKTSWRPAFLYGKMFGCDFSGDTVMPTRYNNYAGPCVFERVVATMYIEIAKDRVKQRIDEKLRSAREACHANSM